MENKRILVTGATSGIGRETVRGLAKKGAQIIVMSRNEQKCRETVDELNDTTGRSDADYFVADLSIMDDIRSAAEKFQEKYDRLDVLLNNAGAIFTSRQETPDGYEKTLALNHLNYFLLTNLLLDTLRDSAPSRIVNVASGAHYGNDIDFDDLQREQSYSGYKVYGESKLMNILFTYELDRRLDTDDVTANALHPGFVASNFGHNNSLPVRILMSLTQLFARSEKKGAETSIYLASSPDVEGVSGKYFSDKKPKESSPQSYDEKTARRLWEVSEELVGLEMTI
ncbi:MAG: SDR family oxidoreductase [Candidatus Marinimicrobia bacterium]|nr:SDR family oxidoreductase [Candidatus Neomarinimicrobiota bacterium]MCF7827759.1 SDR family oxidoreductase [Candidatus Neomarinimicrobiota bacterium]MCF7881441.1 SDR family oxidoreductase [Candidatus Neomarinimicrobiota bacterium]